MEATLFSELDQHVKISAMQIANIQRRTLIRKFNELIVPRDLVITRNRPPTSRQQDEDLDQIVIDLSSDPLDPRTKAVLKKGLSFVPYKKDPPILDLIACVENSLIQVDQSKAARIRSSIAHILQYSRYKRKPNLDREEAKIIRNLKKETNKVITKADKGNKVVILDKTEYINKMEVVLSSDVYTSVEKDPSDITRKSLARLLSDIHSVSHEAALERIKNLLKFPSNFSAVLGRKQPVRTTLLFMRAWSEKVTNMNFCRVVFDLKDRAAVRPNAAMRSVAEEWLLRNPVHVGGPGLMIEEDLFPRRSSDQMLSQDEILFPK
uniref:TFIIS N-terminal domain-containing protein n=1 Tax=Trichuris muris TaxID=70415 RepID=A0A5S6R5K5_TRIMR